MENKQVFASKPKEDKPWDVIVIGSGPAALTSAIYTTRGLASTLILAGEIWGGQLMLTTIVDNFPGFPEGVQGPELMVKMRRQAERFGGVFLTKSATKVNLGSSPFQIEAGNEKYFARTIVIATGASTMWLDVPGMKEFIGRGVSSCAPCDAPFFKDKKVVVVGGGDSAMEEALVLSKYASEVSVVHRRDEFRASQVMQKKVLENKKIRILWNTEVMEVKGDNMVKSVILKNNKTGERLTMAIDGLFNAIGHKPESDIFKGSIEIDERGYIKVHDATRTSVNGVFVAGDVHDFAYKQAITAAGYGCQAGMDALKFLESQV